MRIGAMPNRKGSTLSKKSKYQKSNDNSSQSDGSESTEEPEILLQDNAESSDQDAPVVIEAEAVEVAEAADEAVTEGVEETLDAEDEANKEATDKEATDNVPETEPVEVTEPVITEPAPVEAKRGSVFPALLGGLAAGAIGFFAATFGNQPPEPVDTTAITDSVAETGTRLDALSAELSELKEAPVETVEMPDLSGIETQIAGIATRLDDIDTDIAMVREEVSGATTSIDEKASALSERLTVLETSDGTEGAEATQEELAAFRAELDRMTTEAEARIAKAQTKATEIEQMAAEKAAAAEEAAVLAAQQAAEAEQKALEMAEAAKRQQALVDLKAALESGAPFEDILPLVGEVPEILTSNAAEGVPSLVSIQQAFPDAARNVLSVAEAAPQDASAGQKLTAFLKQQTNARSLKPVEGSGTDAVLSRAEAMLKQGDLPAALNELDGLSDAPKAAMQGWLDKATTRTSAISAAAELSVTN